MPPAAIRDGITETYDGSGSQVFTLNPAGEILDETPFTLQLRNAAADVYLIATNTGHHPMQPQVVRLDRTQGATAAGPPVTGAGRRAQRSADGGNAGSRSSITEFNNDSPLPPSSACRLSPPQTPQPVTAGTTRLDFLSLDADQNHVTIPATARKVVVDGTTTLVVWVADEDWETCPDCISAEMVDALADQFLQPNESNDILQLVTAIFGDPWGTHDRQCLIPAESADVLHILLYDIDDDGLPAPGAARDRGFFWAKDNLPAGLFRGRRHLERAPDPLSRRTAPGAVGRSHLGDRRRGAATGSGDADPRAAAHDPLLPEAGAPMASPARPGSTRWPPR